MCVRNSGFETLKNNERGMKRHNCFPRAAINVPSLLRVTRSDALALSKTQTKSIQYNTIQRHKHTKSPPSSYLLPLFFPFCPSPSLSLSLSICKHGKWNFGGISFLCFWGSVEFLGFVFFNVWLRGNGSAAAAAAAEEEERFENVPWILWKNVEPFRSEIC